MIAIGANMAVLRDDTILLQQREDFEVWCLPGGTAEPGESLAETAIREVLEETGFDVVITGLVGSYTRIGTNPTIHNSCFRGATTGGTMTPQEGEVVGLGWFPVDNLPPDMFWWHRQQVADAVAGIHGAAWRFEVVPAESCESRAQLYEMRDRSGLSRVEFYRYMFESNGTHRSTCHLKGIQYG